jgi:L-lactate dehydrogenase complex protein LldF
MKIETELFKSKADQALGDPALQEALSRACGHIGRMRTRAFQEFPEGDRLRDQAHWIKAGVMEHLESYLAQLEQSATALGIKVHRAETAEDGRLYIENLIQSRGIKLVVKGKSMTTEEIGLNQALEEDGVQVWETDLGEFILQLAGEAPSHIIAPAIHKTQEEIAALFHRVLGVPLFATPEELTRAAREFLRKKYFQAGLGISGANFALARTGTLVVVENEGNARMCTTFPKIHVAVMGIEKVIPGLGELAVFLKILARSATGQKMPTYMSFLNGPARSGEEDGPEEVHLVLLDNGRSRILKDPEMRASLYCLRCGACLNVCPVYQKIGGHPYGWVYSGPIGATIVPQYLGILRAKHLPMASTLCGACATVCPVRIPIPDLLLKLRQRIQEAGGAGFYEKSLLSFWTTLQSHSSWSKAAIALARIGSRLSPKLGSKTAPFPQKTFHQWWQDENPD